MPTESLNYQGINRSITDYASTSACEELINLRPTSQGLVPVKPFSTVMSNVSYDRVFVHYPGNRKHYIALKKGSGYVDIILLGFSGQSVTEDLIERVLVDSGYTHFTVDMIHYATAGNIILFSFCDKEDSFFLNKAYLWKNNAYVEQTADVPPISVTLNPSTYATDAVVVDVSSDYSYSPDGPDASYSELISLAESGLNEIQENNPDVCFGPTIIAIAFKTSDGKTFWTGQWSVYDPTPHIKAHPSTTNPPNWSDNTYINSTNIGDLLPGFISAYTDGYIVAMRVSDNRRRYYLAGVPLSVTIQIPSASGYIWDKDKSIIRSIEIYASKPKVYLNLSEYSNSVTHPTTGSIDALPQLPYDEMELDGQLLYHMESIPMDSLKGYSAVTANLHFGGSQQVTDDTLEVDPGATSWYGRLLSYNARFHYFDAVSKRGIGMPYFLTTQQTTQYHVIVKYEDEDQSEYIYVGTATLSSSATCPIVIAPSLNIKEVITYRKPNDNSYDVVKYQMVSSTNYNYTICVNPPSGHTTSSGTISEYDTLISSGVKSSIFSEEPSAINVTEQYNPFVFLVEHSYLAPGKVLDVQPQMATYTDISYGLYPLNVFTERGLYALLQGSSNVLYGAFQPLSNLVTQRNSIPTEMGTFFLSEGALWLIAGRRTTLISDAIHLGPHKYIRTCGGFKQLSMGQSVSGSVLGYDVTDLQSQVTFETYVQNASLTYNRHRDELYISNPTYAYSYALSLKYRQWFKIDRSLWQDSPGSEIANTPGSSTGLITVVDFTSEGETSVLTHLQSRPFSFGYRYSHIHRIVSMVRACLTNSEKLIVGLYGSDDLQEWTLLSYASRTGESAVSPLRFSQIRTASSARSWRYYTVCIGGATPTDTDFGPFIVDYQGVIRRIG